MTWASTHVVVTVAAEFLWWLSEHADECTTHPFAVAETCRVRELFDRMGAFFEHHTSDLYAQRFDRLCRRVARLSSERARKLTDAEMRSCSEFLDGKVGTKILPCVGERCLDSIGLRRHGQQCGLLTLRSAASEIDDQSFRHLPRDVDTQVRLNQRKREVYARRHPGRRPDSTIVRENAVLLHAHVRISVLQLSCVEPMCGGSEAIKDSSLRQNERPCAD
jgi:hypothetical protein